MYKRNFLYMQIISACIPITLISYNVILTEKAIRNMKSGICQTFSKLILTAIKTISMKTYFIKRILS